MKNSNLLLWYGMVRSGTLRLGQASSGMVW
jgi:hypothetical protein